MTTVKELGLEPTLKKEEGRRTNVLHMLWRTYGKKYCKS